MRRYHPPTKEWILCQSGKWVYMVIGNHTWIIAYERAGEFIEFRLFTAIIKNSDYWDKVSCYIFIVTFCLTSNIAITLSKNSEVLSSSFHRSDRMAVPICKEYAGWNKKYSLYISGKNDECDSLTFYYFRINAVPPCLMLVSIILRSAEIKIAHWRWIDCSSSRTFYDILELWG